MLSSDFHRMITVAIKLVMCRNINKPSLPQVHFVFDLVYCVICTIFILGVLQALGYLD